MLRSVRFLIRVRQLGETHGIRQILEHAFSEFIFGLDVLARGMGSLALDGLYKQGSKECTQYYQTPDELKEEEKPLGLEYKAHIGWHWT